MKVKLLWVGEVMGQVKKLGNNIVFIVPSVIGHFFWQLIWLNQTQISVLNAL